MGFRVHRIGGRGYDSNIYLIEADLIALIDAGTGGLFQSVKEEMEKLGIGLKEIEILINTHCHYDHTGGDHQFQEASGCTVLIHTSEVQVLREGDSTLSCAALFGERLKPVGEVRPVEEGTRIDLGSVVLKVLHTPGHTKGSVCLYDGENGLLFSGDTVFSDGIGRTDLPSGDPRSLFESLNRLEKLEVKKLYPGHGAPNEENPKDSIRGGLRLLREIW